MSETKMIVGLGNPGPRYARNRHNIGFQSLDIFAARHEIQFTKFQLKGVVGDGWIAKAGERRKVLLVKPLTYMNASGEAVGPLASYYRLEPDKIIVLHDDLDLEHAKLRLRKNGGSGGQNGIRSIIQHFGSRDFHRLRVGIGRPPGRMDPAAFVLQNFRPEEEEIFVPLRETICDALQCWLFDGLDEAMNRFNR